MLKILIFGSSSFIGNHLIRHLSMIDNISISVFGRRENNPSVKGLKFFQGDFSDADCLKKALKGF